MQETTTNNIIPLLALVLAMAISIVIIPIICRYASKLGMIDQPGERKVHSTAIPRVGGLGIIIGSIIPAFVLLNLEPVIFSFLVGSAVILLFGMLDDIHELGPYTKFLGQFIAVGFVIYFGDVWIKHPPFTGNLLVPAWFGMPFTFFAIIGMINAINTSDGLDGLAAGESLLSLVVIAFLAYIADGIVATIIAASVMGGIFGFLRYNTHPARIFMGDTGSQYLGFTLGFLAVLVTQQVHTALSPALTLLFLGLPIIDIVYVMIKRIREGHSPFHADRSHIHHRLLDLGFDHYETVIIIYAIQALLVISAIVLRYQSDYLIVGFYLLVAVSLFTFIRYAEKTGWRLRSESPSSITSTVEYLRRSPEFVQLPIKIVSIVIPLYVLITSLLIESVPQDFSIVSGFIFIIMLADLILRKNMEATIYRGGVYIATLFAVYLLIHSVQFSLGRWLDLAFFIVLAVTIAIVVRYAKDKKFKTSPMDYLIVFLVLTIAVFGGRYLQVQETGVMIVKSMIMLYGCELLIIRMTNRWNFLTISTLSALAIFAIRGII